MKSKKRHHGSSDGSEESNITDKSSSTSDSESEDSSESDHRYKKKRKHANSTESESISDDPKRSKKRKHKKKKKKHGKKKRRSLSVISCDNFSISDGEIAKKKKKHKHKKRTRGSSVSEDEEQEPRRLHSVVKERRASSGEGSQPSRTYYQREYRRSESVEKYDREQEVQRFYRGSSKEHKYQQETYNYDRRHNERIPYQSEKFDRNSEKIGHSGRYDHSNVELGYRQREYDEFKRPRYEDRRQEEHYNRRPREDTYYREDPRANNRYNQYEGPKRREFGDNRDFRERRPPPDPARFRERELVDKREKPRQEQFSPGRVRDMRRDRPARPDKPPVPHHRDASKSPQERHKERERPGAGAERAERSRERFARGERRRSDERGGSEARLRERKTRFTNADENKEYSWGKTEVKKEDSKGAGDKEKPNFGLSGKLTADTNTVNGVVLKYSEPDDAKQPKRRWRFYPFKGDKALPILYIHRQSCFLLGRDKAVCDISLEHPSVSKQHAALQYRATPFARADGSQGRRVRPYIIDLDSANGTFVNNKKIEARRYVELLERDVVKFGFSQREYVLLHENSKDDAQDDDQPAALGDAVVTVVTADQVKRDKRVKEEIAADGD